MLEMRIKIPQKVDTMPKMPPKFVSPKRSKALRKRLYKIARKNGYNRNQAIAIRDWRISTIRKILGFRISNDAYTIKNDEHDERGKAGYDGQKKT